MPHGLTLGTSSHIERLEMVIVYTTTSSLASASLPSPTEVEPVQRRTDELEWFFSLFS
jgi:hypothetical protein